MPVNMKNACKIIRSKPSLLLLVFLTACGGGGSGNGGSAGVEASGPTSIPGVPVAPTPGTPALDIFTGDIVNAGATDGIAGVATFNGPAGITKDSAGNFYVVDSRNQIIRKITPAGTVSTVAGATGIMGYAEGVGTMAKFRLSADSSIAVDKAGTIYVADTSNNAVRRVSQSGEVTTLAGTGFAGNVDGNGTAAGFNRPTGIATDPAGNVYVADSFNHAIRLITPTGQVSTMAGSGNKGMSDGVGAAAQFNEPSGVASDSAGNIYVADTGNQSIRKIRSDRLVTTLVGNSGLIDAGDVPVILKGLATDAAGNIYVADFGNNKVRMITATGVASTMAGGGGISSFRAGIPGALPPPTGVVVSGSSLYVTTGNGVAKISPLP